MQTPPKPPIYKTKSGRLAIAAVVFLFVCLCCFFASVLAPEEPVDVQATAEAQAWQAVTETALAVPTETAVPTVTPTPRPVEEPYITALRPVILEYLENYKKFLEQVTKAAEDPSVIFDETWTLETALTMVLLEETASKLDNLEGANENTRTLEGYVKAIASETRLMVKNYSSGVDNLDVSALERATANITLITEYTKLATQEIERLNSR